MKLKQIVAFCLLVVFTACLTNCKAKTTTVSTKSTKTTKALPPGKAKKVNGDKSAKKYAPGHN